MFKTIRTKLMVILVLLSLVPLMIFGIMYYISSKSLIQERFKITSSETVTEISRGIENTFSGIESLIDVMANNEALIDYAKGDKEKEELAFDLLKGIQESNDLIISSYMGTPKKGMYLYPEEDMIGYDPTERVWYTSALKSNGEIVYTEPYMDFNDGSIIVTLSRAVKKDGELIGVIAVDIDLNEMAKSTAGIQIGDTGYVIITTADGLMLSHPDKELVGTDIVTTLAFWNDYRDNESGFNEYFFNGIDKYIAFETISTGWKVGICIDEEELMGRIEDIRNVMIAVLGILAFIAVVIVFLFSLTISKTVRQLKEAFEKSSNGDFTSRVNVKTKDEFKILGDSFNKMAENISELINDVKKSSDTVYKTSSNLSDMTQEVSASVQQVACSMEEISRGTVEQASSTQESSFAAHNLSQMVDGIRTLINEINELSEKANKLGNNGLDTVTGLASKSEVTKVKTLEVNDIITELSNSIKSISVMTSTITNITDQTNLLSLNASIEAARAGEHGRGFAVVAEEIRFLAEQSRKSAVEINDIISDVTKKTNKAFRAMEKTKETVMEQDMAVVNTKDIFADIINSIQLLNKKIEVVVESTDNMDANKNDIVAAMETISAVSQETASATEEVSASTEEVSATMDSFSQHSVELSKLAEKLKKNIDKFIV